MILEIIKAVYFFLPAYFANMSPPLVFNIPFIKKINYPLDFKKTLFSNRILGNNKTIIGSISGILASLIIFQVQKYLFNFNFFQNISILNYSQLNLLFPLLLGFGAIFGDLLKSFIKRRLNIKPGASFPIVNQLDFVIFALLLSSLVYIPSIKTTIILIILTPFLCILINFIAFKLKVKKVWY